MENQAIKFYSRAGNNIALRAIPGHFATNHSHVNYYIDMTKIKTSHKMCKAAANELASQYANTHIDTIIALEGTIMLASFLAQSLSEAGINVGTDINVVTPEKNVNNQMIFRDNVQHKICNKQILLLISSASTGKSISRAVDCLQYYSGNLAGIAAIFSAIEEFNSIPIRSVFGLLEIPNYKNCAVANCPMCASGQKVDAIVNSFGYSKL